MNKVQGRLARRYLPVFISLTAIALGTLACREKPQSSPAVATVGTDKLTVEDLLAEIPDEMQDLITRENIQEYVQRWVNSQLLLQEARRRGLDRKVALQRELRKMERELLVSELLEQELDKRRLVSEEEVRKYYDENPESFKRGTEEVHLLHLLVADQTAADSILQRIRMGETFESIAREVVLLNGSDVEWDLGYVSPEELPPEIARRVFRRRPGSAALAIRSAYGVHLCKVVDKQPKGSMKSLEEVKDEITIKLTAQKRQQRFQQLLSRLRNETEIITNYQVLEQVFSRAVSDSVDAAHATQR